MWRHIARYLAGCWACWPSRVAEGPADRHRCDHAGSQRGAAPNLQLHIIIPGSYVTPQGVYGIGDVELGARNIASYRKRQNARKLVSFRCLKFRPATADLDSATDSFGRACLFGSRKATVRGRRMEE